MGEITFKISNLERDALMLQMSLHIKDLVGDALIKVAKENEYSGNNIWTLTINAIVEFNNGHKDGAAVNITVDADKKHTKIGHDAPIPWEDPTSLQEGPLLAAMIKALLERASFNYNQETGVFHHPWSDGIITLGKRRYKFITSVSHNLIEIEANAPNPVQV